MYNFIRFLHFYFIHWNYGFVNLICNYAQDLMLVLFFFPGEYKTSFIPEIFKNSYNNNTFVGLALVYKESLALISM